MSTAISWTNETWNPVVGCTKVSQGCKFCYAKQLHDMRHKAFLAGKKVAPQYAKPFGEVQVMDDRFLDPLRWRRPRRVFVNSVSDLFHEDIDEDRIAEVFGVMALAHQHTFQALTKRADRMRDIVSRLTLVDALASAGMLFGRVGAEQRFYDLLNDRLRNGPYEWPLSNVWLGTSVEDQKAADARIPELLRTPAAVRFLSCEPLIGPVSFRWALWDDHTPHPRRERQLPPVERDGRTLAGSVNHLDGLRMLDWIIVGGESGSAPRGEEDFLAWMENIVGECREAGVPVFVKQDVARKSEQRGRIPDALWIRQYPGDVLDGVRHTDTPTVAVPR